ncbi:MAG: multidrug efflux MFS transporter [Lentisphaerae bacterium]|nr:multidrug efflux MFS transporter [Lentisphaerota bacterium]
MIGWKKTFISSFLAQVLSMLGFSFALPFLPFFIGELGISKQDDQALWAGIILGATGVTLAIFAPLWGVMADRYGRKKMVIRSMFGGTLVLILMSFSRNIFDLLICRLIQGALTGTVSASIALVASVTPIRRSGFALGMMQAAAFVGVAVGPLVGGLIADAYSYRVAFRIGALIILSGGLMVQFGAIESVQTTEEKQEKMPSLLQLLKASGVFAAILILLSVRFANTIINPSFPLVIADIIHNPERLNSITGMIMAFGGTSGAIAAGLFGYIGDKIGHRKIVILCSFGAAVTATAHAFAQSIAALTVANLFFAMTTSGILPAVNAMIQGSTDQKHIGKAFGLAASISMIGLAIGPLSGGYLAKEINIRAPFIAAGICQLLVTGLAWRSSVSLKRTHI